MNPVFQDSIRMVLLATIATICAVASFAQTPNKPLTSKEIVSRVYELPQHPERRDAIVEEIRTRGIDFPLTSGLRSLVATKSGNDPLLRRTLEEAERRRLNPTASALPPANEANELLERTRVATLAAAEAMPDFIVKQLIRRTIAFGKHEQLDSPGQPRNRRKLSRQPWRGVQDLSVNGQPLGPDVKESKDYSKYVGGASSSGVEYISALADMFRPSSETTFKPVDTDLLNNDEQLSTSMKSSGPNSKLTLTADRTAQLMLVRAAGCGLIVKLTVSCVLNRSPPRFLQTFPSRRQAA